MLKAGWRTVLFNVLLQDKTPTQLTKGGNTKLLYGAGTYAKSKMLADAHPDITEVKVKFHRWHHKVDYTIFKQMKLIDANPEDMPDDINEKFNFKLADYGN